MRPTIGRQIGHVATTIHGPANRTSNIGMTTRASHTTPIQVVTAEISRASERSPAARNPGNTSSVAPTAAIATTEAAMKAIVSLPAMISPYRSGRPRRSQSS